MNAKYKAENEIQAEKLKQIEQIFKEKDDAYRELNVKYIHLSKNSY